MTSRARLALAVMMLVALVSVVYAPVRQGVFVWDDHALIESNAVVQGGSVTEIFGQPYWTASSLSDVRPSYYRPLTTLTLRADFAVAGDDARSFHVSNLLMHLLATIALALVARRLGAGPLAAVLAAAAWAVHPRVTEAVAWISGRADVLACLAALVAVGVWPFYVERPREGEAATRLARRDLLRASVTALAVLAGLLAKEVAIAAVIAVAVGTVVGLRRAGRSTRERAAMAARRLSFVAVPVVVYAGLRLAATWHMLTSQLTPLGATARGATILEALGRYLEMTMDPWHPTTSIGLVGEIDPGSVVLGLVVLGVVTALLVRAAVRARHGRGAPATTAEPGALGTTPASPRAALAAIAALGLASLALVVHVVPIALASGVAADRLLYLPLAALAIGAAVVASGLGAAARNALGAFAVVLIATFVPVTRARAADYTDELRFRLVAAEHAHPRNTSAKSGLANMLRADAETKLACTLHASVRRTLEQSGLTGSPRYLRALENLGGCYAALGSYEEAERTYATIVGIQPDHPRVHMELGYLGLHTFDVDRAEREFRRALELDPKLEPARASLAVMPALRARLARFATEDARLADRIGWARLVTSLGRIPDATNAWSAVLADPALDETTAWTGLQHLLANADVATAQRAVDIAARRHFLSAETAKARLARRMQAQARIDELRPRIEALAHAGARPGPNEDGASAP